MDPASPDTIAFFRAESADASATGGAGEQLVPLALARSSWSAEQAHGVAVSGALARTAEAELRRSGRDDLRITKWSVDLFRPVRMQPVVPTAVLVRQSSRLALIDVVLHQDGEPVARASALALAPSETPPAPIWTPSLERPTPPPAELAPVTDVPHVPFFRSASEWSQSFADHQNAGPHTEWATTPRVVAGEAHSPFQAAACVADAANLVTNWGEGGVGHINADLTMTLVRPPVGVSLGVQVLDRLEQDGIVVGTTTIFDREGVLGTVVVTAMANTRRQIDFSTVRYRDDGTRTEPGA